MTDSNTTGVPSPLAVSRAWALARAHGHQWASFYEGPETAPTTHEEALSRNEAATSQDLQGWGTYYNPNDAGCVAHTTGTGRVRWYVEADGCVEVTVSRPGGDVLRAEWLPRHVVPVVSCCSANFGLRHVAALLDCVRAISPDAAADVERALLLELPLEELESEVQAATRAFLSVCESQLRGELELSAVKRSAERLGTLTAARDARVVKLPKGCTAPEARASGRAARKAFLHG